MSWACTCRAACVAAGVAFVAFRALSAQQPGEITGRVVAPDGSPVAAVNLTLEGTTLATRAGTDGRFRLRGLSPGVYRLAARALGYRPAALEVIVADGATVDLRIALTRAALEVGAVTVIGSREDVAETADRLRLVPGAVRLVQLADIRSTRQANLKDVLRFTPGVYVQPRFGAADESQLSIRGSGLRNNFHLRGVNLLVNGMPYRNADGFTDFESLELLTTQAIEVYKGGNALRYGGSTLGGAVNLVTETGYTSAPFSVFGEGGAFGFYKAQLASGSSRGRFDYYASYARTALDGFREWSDQQRDRVNLHAGYVLSPGVDLRGFYLFARVREHLPGALTSGQIAVDPTRADSVNVADRWGRDYDLHHLGVQLRAQLGPTQRLEIAPYFQYRDIDHPIFRVLAQVSRDIGAEVRYENTTPVGGRPHRLTLGVQPSYGNVDNRHYDNVRGAHGALRKDQRDAAGGVAAYAEDVLALGARLSLITGLRYDHAVRKITDHFLSDGDQSDERTFEVLLPKIGLLYDIDAGRAQLFANASRSFEPPLLLELNSLTGPGFIDLDGQGAWQFELGTRGRADGFAWDVAAYDVELENEILNANVPPFQGAPFTVPTYRNAKRTRHYGVEAGLEYQVPGDWARVRVAYTFARNRFVEDSVFSGNEVPGMPRHFVQAEVRLTHPSGFTLAPTVEWVPQAYVVNSANTARNRGWTTLGVRAEWEHPDAGLTAFLAVQNLTDRRYAGSVQVDNAAGKHYEPADGRSVYAGLRWRP